MSLKLRLVLVILVQVLFCTINAEDYSEVRFFYVIVFKASIYFHTLLNSRMMALMRHYKSLSPQVDTLHLQEEANLKLFAEHHQIKMILRF